MARQDLDEVDPHLADLADGVEPFVKVVESDPEYSLLILGVREFIDPKDDSGEPNMKTFFGVIGDPGAVAEGMFEELMEQVENGNMNLFAVLRQVIRDMEEMLDMTPEDEIELELDMPHSNTVH